MSEQKTVLFMSFNVLSHVNSLLGIADFLKREGYKTKFLIIEPPVKVVEEHGHELITMKKVKSSSAPEKKLTPEEEKASFHLWVTTMKKDYQLEPVEGFIKVVNGFLDGMLQEIKDNHDNYISEINRINPDLLIIDSASNLPGFTKLTIPWVMICSHNPLLYYKRDILPGGVRIPAWVGAKLLKDKKAREELRLNNPDTWNAMVNEWKRIQDKFDKASIGEEFADFYKKHSGRDLHEDMVGQGNRSPYLNLSFFPQEVDYDVDDDLFEFPSNWLKCDRLIRDTNPNQVEPWQKRLKEGMKGKTQMVYFSLGTLVSFDVELIKHYIDIFREDKERLYVISMGAARGVVELGENMIGEEYLPQVLILEHADLAIHHGGANTLVECLHAGVPSIILPAFNDQFDCAQRVEDLEIGKRLSLYKCTKDELRKTIDEVLADEDMKMRNKEISRKIKSRSNDRQKLSKVLRKLIERGSLEQSFIDSCNRNEELLF